MKKGFVLMTDMFLAISLMALLLASSVYVMRNYPDWKRVRETMIAEDLLVSMQANNVLQTLNETVYSEFIDEYVPQQYKLEFIVSVYNASELRGEVAASRIFLVKHPVNASEPTDFGIVKKSFLIKEYGVLDKFCIAEVRVWV